MSSSRARTLRATVAGVGHYLPDRVVENGEFEKWLDTSDQWIRTRTGIERRHFAAKGQNTSDLAIRAARAALADAHCTPGQVDAIIVATSTPDFTFPSVATMVQAALGMTNGFAFDVQAVCAGFIYAMGVANAHIMAGQADRVLIIGAETFSRIMDWNDRSTCVLFGDGAGAMVLEAREGKGTSDDRGILSTDLHADGRYRNLLHTSGGVSATQTTGHLVMQGRDLFRHAVEKIHQSIQCVLEKANLRPCEIDWVVPHQANLRIINKIAEKSNIPLEKILITIQDQGNTSAASIPLAISVRNARTRFESGDLLIATAIGGGLAWGAVALRW